MTTRLSRRAAARTLSGTGAVLAAAAALRPHMAFAQTGPRLKGNVNHSVCKWCYGKIPLEEMCQAGKQMGLASIELLGPEDWPTLKKHGLICAMCSGPSGPKGIGGIGNAWNRVENHDWLVEAYEKRIAEVADAGFTNVICFSGNRAGLDDEKGIENCAIGLQRLMKTAEKHRVNVVMELLNSKVNHKDYQCDHTAWGVALVKKVGSERMKLLYDIYHMQIMEGDLIATIKESHPFIAHYHTGGVPGRNEIDETQEIYYPSVMKAILATGFKGHVAQEFIPKRADALASLRQGVSICDV
jgi:hydroxypyruvate isomerase